MTTTPGPREAVGTSKRNSASSRVGILTGRARAGALDHVEQCPHCRAELDRLSLAADDILQTTADAEPPVGFELRLFERLGLRRPTRRRLIGRLSWTSRVETGVGRASVASSRRSWSGWLHAPAIAAIGALFALGLGFGGSLLAGSGASVTSATSGRAGGLTWGPLVTKGHSSGNYVLVNSAHTNPWLYMSIDDRGVTGPATCMVTLATGKTLPVGTYWLGGKYDSWGVHVPSRASVRAAWVVTGSGTVLARAQLPA